MKYVCLLITIFIISACNNKKTDGSAIVQKLLRTERSLDKQEKKIIKEISNAHRTSYNFDVSKLVSCSFCDFDAKKFVSNPSPEKLLTCLSESKTEKYFIQTDGKKEFLLTVCKMKDGWRMHTKERWDGQSLLLKKMLQEAGSERYLIFRYGFDRFVVYHTPNGVAYCTTNGRKINSEGVCEFLVASINKKDPFIEKLKMTEKEEKQDKIFELLEKYDSK